MTDPFQVGALGAASAQLDQLLELATMNIHALRSRAASFIDVGRRAAGERRARASSKFGRRASELNSAADTIEQLRNYIRALPSAPSSAPAWQPIATAPQGLTNRQHVIVALIRDGVVRRISEARFNGIGWYDKAGTQCHWRTHWMPLPDPPASASPEPDETTTKTHARGDTPGSPVDSLTASTHGVPREGA